MNISGKRALVTGGSSGIGFEMARQLLERGARVVITGRRKQTLDDAVRALTASGEIVGVPADVTTPEGRERSLHTALQALGTGACEIDVFVKKWRLDGFRYKVVGFSARLQSRAPTNYQASRPL